jgi:ADP-heptose:LPS heptosyltransferase
VLTENEITEAKHAVEDLRKNGKKVMVVQPWGSQGGIPLPDGHSRADESYRSFPWAFYKEFAEHFAKDYTILSVQANVIVNNQAVGQYTMKDTVPFNNQDVRKVIAVLPYVDVVVACDSFIHHASAALGTPVKTIVLWGGTSEKNLGYDGQVNLRNARKPFGFEPNRVPHDHSLYVNKNKGISDFVLEDVKKAVETEKPKRGKK